MYYTYMNTNYEAIIDNIMIYINTTKDDKWTIAYNIKKIIYKINRNNFNSNFIEFLFNYFKDYFEKICNKIDEINNIDIKKIFKNNKTTT